MIQRSAAAPPRLAPANGVTQCVALTYAQHAETLPLHKLHCSNQSREHSGKLLAENAIVANSITIRFCSCWEVDHSARVRTRASSIMMSTPTRTAILCQWHLVPELRLPDCMLLMTLWSVKVHNDRQGVLVSTMRPRFQSHPRPSSIVEPST